MNLNPGNLPLTSLDVFRGMTVALMIIVNSPGNSTPYDCLASSSWNGLTLADLVLPFFIVIVGISSELVLTNFKATGSSTPFLLAKVIQRTGYIFLIGLILNAIPHFDLSTLQILGILQRIAICYFFSAFLFLTTRIQTQTIIMLVLIIGYGSLMTYIPSTPDLNLAGKIDRQVLGAAHLYTPTIDPEGLFSTLPAIASVLLGNLIGFGLRSLRTNKQKLRWMSVAGSMLVFLGWIWSFTLPINRTLWSSSFVLLTAGIALLVFSALYFLIEIKHVYRWSKPFELFGRHAILVYTLHILFLKIQDIIFIQTTTGATVNFRVYITEVLFSHFTAENAALSYAVSYTLLWLLVMTGVEKWQRKKG